MTDAQKDRDELIDESVWKMIRNRIGGKRYAIVLVSTPLVRERWFWMNDDDARGGK